MHEGLQGSLKPYLNVCGCLHACLSPCLLLQEDPFNAIMAGAATGGFLQLRAGLRPAFKSAVVGGVLLVSVACREAQLTGTHNAVHCLAVQFKSCCSTCALLLDSMSGCPQKTTKHSSTTVLGRSSTMGRPPTQSSCDHQPPPISLPTKPPARLAARPCSLLCRL